MAFPLRTVVATRLLATSGRPATAPTAGGSGRAGALPPDGDARYLRGDGRPPPSHSFDWTKETCLGRNVSTEVDCSCPKFSPGHPRRRRITSPAMAFDGTSARVTLRCGPQHTVCERLARFGCSVDGLANLPPVIQQGGEPQTRSPTAGAPAAPAPGQRDRLDDQPEPYRVMRRYGALALPFGSDATRSGLIEEAGRWESSSELTRLPGRQTAPPRMLSTVPSSGKVL